MERLVNAILETGLFTTHINSTTFSQEDDLMIKVCFDPKDDLGFVRTDHFITYLMTEFNKKYSFSPVTLQGYKKYMPNDNYQLDATYWIEITPFQPKKNYEIIQELEESISQAEDIIMDYIKVELKK